MKLITRYLIRYALWIGIPFLLWYGVATLILAIVCFVGWSEFDFARFPWWMKEIIWWQRLLFLISVVIATAQCLSLYSEDIKELYPKPKKKTDAED